MTYQWLHNDEEIPGAVEKTYTVTAKDQEDCGVYSVRILSQGGTSKTVDVCEIKCCICCCAWRLESRRNMQCSRFGYVAKVFAGRFGIDTGTGFTC